MKAIVVFESVYGNTRAVAEAVADGLGGAEAVPVREAAERDLAVSLLVVGGPTHMHGLATTRGRRIATEAAHEDGGVRVGPGATEEPGLRAWLRNLAENEGALAATFDTRPDKSPWVTGIASRGIAKRLRRHGYNVLATESFLVEDTEGPLEEESSIGREPGVESSRTRCRLAPDTGT